MRSILLYLFLTASLSAGNLSLNIEGESALLMNAKTGQVLFEKKGYTRVYPASTTKIATALVALHKARGELGILLTADREALASITPEAKKQSNYRSPPHWLETDSSLIGIKKGEELRLLDLLNGMMIASGNDAANVIAMGLGTSVTQFMEEVNLYLKGLGCRNTHYNNPHGLHHPEHFTTAYELALMARAVLKEPVLRDIVSTPRYIAPQTNLTEERIFTQTNLLLRNGEHFYPKAIGIKTGYTQAAGKNLVAAAQSGNRELIAVVAGYRGPRSELYRDVIKLFEAGFNESKVRRRILPQGIQKLTVKLKGARSNLRTYLEEDLIYEFYPSEEVGFKLVASWDIPPLPIKRGDLVGTLKIIDDQSMVFNEMPLFALEDVKSTLWHQMHLWFVNHKIGIKIASVAGLSLVLIGLWEARRKRVRR